MFSRSNSPTAQTGEPTPPAGWSCQSVRASSRADRAHGTETGYAGRRTSREDSVSVHRDGVINAYRNGRTAATNETAGYRIHGFPPGSLHAIAGGSRHSACHATGRPFASAGGARSAIRTSWRR